MGVLVRLLGGQPEAATPDAWDNFWYNPISQPSSAGVRVTADSALAIPAVWACVRVLAETLASLPLFMYKRRDDGGKERAPNHPLSDVIQYQPNRWQTSFEWRETLMQHLVLRGNAFCEIMPGARGAVSELIPLHPDRVTVERVPGTGLLRYIVTPDEAGAPKRELHQNRVFHLRGLSADGINGMSVIEYGRNSMGLQLATDSFAARRFSQDSSPGGLLEHPGKLGEEAAKRLAQSWQQAHAGVQNAHKVAVLEEGIKWHQVGLSAQDSQYIESRQFGVAEVARWFRMPPHLIQDLLRSTNNNIEHQGIEFVVHTMRPWFVRWEQAIRRDLILAQGTYFAEFMVDGLLRGDIKSRYEAYASAITAGWKSRNEVRLLENLNPGPEELDEFLAPLNMRDSDDPVPLPAPKVPSKNGQAKLLAEEAATRLVRKMVVAASKAGARHADDQESWEAWLDAFFATHADHVAESLHIEPQAAKAYAEETRNALQHHGVRVMETLEQDWAGRLAALALGGDE